MSDKYEKVRIGSFQGFIKENDFDANMKKVLEVIDQTKDDGLDFLCFPETYLSGILAESVFNSAVSIDDPRIVHLIESTKDYDTVYLVGMSERRSDGIYNVQLVFYKGEILGCSTKTMLTPPEFECFITDLEMPVYEVKGIKFGIAICHSTSFIEPSLYLRYNGARLLFTPHYNSVRPAAFCFHRRMVLNNNLGIASLLKMVVVRSNVIVIDPSEVGCGDSDIWDMDGNCVAKGDQFKEMVVTADLEKKMFLEDHWIDQREISIGLLDKLYESGKMFLQGG